MSSSRWPIVRAVRALRSSAPGWRRARRARRRSGRRACQGVSRPLMRTMTSRAPKPPAVDRVRDLLARRRLGVGRDRILEVEDDGVGRQRARLLDRAGVRSRHVEHAAARTDGHGKAPNRSHQSTRVHEPCHSGSGRSGMAVQPSPDLSPNGACRPMREEHDISAAPDRRVSGVSRRPACRGAGPLSRAGRTRAVARDHGDRLLRLRGSRRR